MKKTHNRGHRINAVLSVIIGILLALICAIAAYATVTASSSTWTPYGGNLARKLLVKVTTTGKNVDAAKYTVTATGAMGIYKDNLKASINGDVFIQSSGTDSHTHKAMTTKNYTYKDGGTNHTETYYKIGSKSATYTKAHSAAKKYGFAHCQKPKTEHTPLRNATAKEAVTVPAHAQYTVTYNANTLDTAGNKLLGTPSGIPAVSVNCTSAVTCQDSVDKIQCDKSDTKLANPTLTGYIFGGWNTSSDGSGTAYKAGADAPDKSITLYAQWTKEPDKKAQFDTGRNVNVKLKKLAGNSSAAYTSTDNTIKEIKRSAAAPASGVTTVDLSPEQSGYLSIPAWISNGTVYYYCSEQNISLAEDSSYMLYLLSSVASIDTSGWNSYPAVNMSRMFSGCKSIKTIDVSKFQTESCEVMDYMFDMCNTLTSLDLSNFCFEKVDSAEGMFKSCSAITEITFPKSENARSITNTAHMFEWCGSIKRIDLSGLEFEGITNADNMFYGCASLEHLNISSLDMRSFGSSVTKFYGGMGALKTIVLGRNCILTPVADTFPPSGTWKNMSTGKKYSETELVEAFDANPLGMAATYEKMSYSFSKKSTNTAKTGIDVKRITPQNGKAKLEAQLKHGQKLNIFGLNDGAKYKITEKGTKQYAPSYTTEAEKATRLKASADIGLDLSTPEEMIGPNAVYNFVNTKTEQEGYELAIKKKLSGDLIENSDKDREFNFYYHIKGLDPDISYKIYLPGAAVSEDSEDYDATLVKSVTPTTDKKPGDIGYDTSGEIEEYFSMKAGGDDITKAYRIEGLPKGAQFIVEEIAASGEGTTLPDGFETEFPYDTKYEVTVGSDSTNKDAAAGISKLDEDGAFNNVLQALFNTRKTKPLNWGLQSGVETFGDENIEYTFTNSRSAKHSFEIEKKVEIDGQITTSSQKYAFELIGTDLEPNKTYTSTDGSVSFTTDDAGNIPTNSLLQNEHAVKITLQAGKTLRFENIPGTAKLGVEEIGVKFVPKFVLKDTENNKVLKEEMGTYGKNSLFDMSDQLISTDQKLTVTNSRKSSSDLTINKTITGDGANDSDTFSAHIELKNLEQGKTYDATGNGPKSVTADSNGECKLDITLKNGSSYTIAKIPSNATFKITEEKSSKGYTPSYEVETLGGIEQLNASSDKGESLSTPWETLATDSSYTFTNTKDAPEPKKTVSDEDNITKDGTGEEKEVTENTVENRNSTWTYTIKQEVQPGASNFSITDYMPPYLETILSEDPDNNLVHAKFYKKDGTAVEGAIVKTDVPSENPDTEEVTTYKNDAYSISYDTSDISGTLTASLHDKELLKAGGTAELTFTVFLPPDISMDELKEAGCINSDASEIKFKNQGETIVSDNKFDTNQTTTHIPLDTGLTIKKNVIGKLGDKTKEFKYNINLQNLTPETEYTFSTPENVTVSAEYNSNTGQITFTALNEKKNPKKNVNISIYENTEDRDRIGTISTGKDGTATMNLSTGDYVAAISGTEQTFSIETTYAGSGVGTVTTAIEGYKQMVVPSKGEITKFSSDANGKADVSFTLKHGKSVSFDDLPAGATYNVTELADPQYTASYVVQKGVGTVTTPTKTNFSNNEEISTGENSLVAENAVTIQFNNVVNTKKITINKVQAGGSQELSGAKLTLKNSDGDTIETWVSDGKAKDLEVAYGETYTLTEDDAPAGYEIAESITFRITSEGLLEIKKDGSWQEQKTANVTMEDALSEFDIEFEKRDFRTEDMLSGAELVLKTSNGKVIKSWKSTSTSEKIKLTKGDYILSESSAPKGYDKTEDIRFSVNESGKVVSSTSQTAVNDKTVTMYDDKESKNVVIEKKVKGSLGDTEYDFHFTGTFTGLTKGVTYEVGDNLTMKADENGNAKVTFTLKDGEKIIIKKLPVGATYTFAEESNNHKASYEITSDEKNAVIAKKEAANDESNKALSTEIENVDSTDGNINVTFINYRGLTAVTGIPGDIHHLLLAITLCGLIVGAIVKRKKKYKL